MSRPRRAAADRAAAALASSSSSSSLVAEFDGLHPSKSIALTSQDVVEDVCHREAIFRNTATTIVTLYTDDRPKGLPRGTAHVGAYFKDCQKFDDNELAQHLDDVVAKLDAAGTQRVVFVCQAGINRSSLALCYYCTKSGAVSWQQAKAALVAAKGHAARSWPTLENQAFEAFLRRWFDSAPVSPQPLPPQPEVKAVGKRKDREGHLQSDVKAKEKCKARGEHWFWRTVATARPSTRGALDPQAVTLAWEAGLRAQGINPKTGRTWGCWENGKQGGRWIRGEPGKRRPWPGA